MVSHHFNEISDTFHPGAWDAPATYIMVQNPKKIWRILSSLIYVGYAFVCPSVSRTAPIMLVVLVLVVSSTDWLTASMWMETGAFRNHTFWSRNMTICDTYDRSGHMTLTFPVDTNKKEFLNSSAELSAAPGARCIFRIYPVPPQKRDFIFFHPWKDLSCGNHSYCINDCENHARLSTLALLSHAGGISC